MSKTNYIVMPRDMSHSISIEGAACTLTTAIAAGMTINKPFDVHMPSGAVAWVWEQRS